MNKYQIVAAALGVLAIPGLAGAHGGNNDANMVHACIGNVSKVVRIVGVSGTCISSPPLVAETPAHWPQLQGTGPKGDKGDPGTNGIDGTSVAFAGYFQGDQNGCANGGAIFTAGGLSAYVCNGLDGTAAAARADGPCFDNTNRYVNCGNGAVTDTVTGLIWLQRAGCLGEKDWASANQAAADLADGQCGLTDGSLPGDWRLPTKDEWEATVAPALLLGCTASGAGAPSLTNDPGTGCLAAGPTSFVGVPLFGHWSASAIDPGSAWGETLIIGILFTDAKTSTFNSVWPVRGGHR